MEDKYIKTDVEGLVKDRRSNAVLNVDNDKLAAYRKRKQFMQQTHDQTTRLENVENQINDIHSMLSTILEKLNK